MISVKEACNIFNTKFPEKRIIKILLAKDKESNFYYFSSSYRRWDNRWRVDETGDFAEYGDQLNPMIDANTGDVKEVMCFDFYDFTDNMEMEFIDPIPYLNKEDADFLIKINELRKKAWRVHY